MPNLKSNQNYYKRQRVAREYHYRYQGHQLALTVLSLGFCWCIFWICIAIIQWRVIHEMCAVAFAGGALCWLLYRIMKAALLPLDEY